MKDPYNLPLWKPYQLAFLGLPFFLLLSFVSQPRLCTRMVDHNDDGEGEHDRPDHTREQDQQGHYLG